MPLLLSPGHLPLFWILSQTSYLNRNLLSSFIRECVSSTDGEVTSKKFVDSVQGQLKLTVLKQDLIYPHEILAVPVVKRELGQNSSHKGRKKRIHCCIFTHMLIWWFLLLIVNRRQRPRVVQRVRVDLAAGRVHRG